MWSHLSPYRNQLDNANAKTGKELCDLLVVFEDDIFIFQDKAVKWPKNGTIVQQWGRWKRKAIDAAAKQLFGAERWLRTHPERVYADRQCAHRLPVHIPPPNRQRIHRLIVASGAAKACSTYHGGSSGALMLSTLRGAQNEPFVVPATSSSGKIIHVLDESNLQTILGELDTLPEFRDYLVAKEELLISGTNVTSAGEEDMLAAYLLEGSADVGRSRSFGRFGDFDIVNYSEWLWREYANGAAKAERQRANEFSYLWDSLIERFAKHAIEGTQYHKYQRDPRDTERTLRCMNAEPRGIRRALIQGVRDREARARKQPYCCWGYGSASEGGTQYTFLTLRREAGEPHEEYRARRAEMLLVATVLMRKRKPDADNYVGIGMNSPGDSDTSEDALYLTKEVYEEEQERALKLQKETGFLQKLIEAPQNTRDYPGKQAPKAKGATRNAPCPCGSGLKRKRCCG